MFRLIIVTVVVAVVTPQDNHVHHDHSHGSNCTFTAARECDFDAHHLHCHDPEDDSIHLCIGDSVPMSHCRQMTCLHHDGDVVVIRTCHNIVPKQGCRLSAQDDTKHYPDCCPQEICD